MSSDGQLVSLGELLEITSSKRIHMADYVAAGVPFYRSKEIIERSKGNKISTELFIAPAQFAVIKQKFGSPTNGDILLTSVGTLGVPYVVKGDGDFYFKDGNLTWMRNFTAEVNSQFLYYWLSSPRIQQKLDEISIGSTQKALTISALKTLKILLPSRTVQDGIVEILGAISDRITLLRETNVTLEAIPKAIFKSWFVDFDPTISKVEGKKQQDISAEIESLFPNSFEQSELGKLPKGWKVEWLSDVFDFKEGPGIRNWQYTNTEEGTRFINIRCIQNGDLEVGTANRISDVEANGKYAHFHLQEWDVVVSTSGTLGRSGIVRKEHLPLMLNTSVIRFRPISHKTTFGFVYCYINAPEFLYKIESMASGSVQKNFGPMHLNQIKMICPNFELMEYFDNLTKPLFEKLIANRRHIENLVELRDALIPRLVSGQINDLEIMKNSEKRLTEHL